ncbi:hypothetical protein FOXG_21455 [Fusarium oxysporum f. sp. lycopersici 4287]|uniref:Uncharacterized protein n=1 Tax=Fusarium oxysporum f. sp. lycopersici (strain 4287 / CBS 123668 / FGSC 9935 / NRRL 34936) TaxID=426428 RepID=A0A0J9WTB2_FUSO4|nr:hypothetical protein FOXG_21455 [Fusarium oxysporum f. sp. lycopersici 4287]EWZ77437.1 hypothetical protein FOWG_18152 [Fusarium oxysporum f. sp. lycopersici MN25]KAJ9413807.1 hypothetical protein QL093DRAFT_2500656 [Fusarium oxysporum]KNB15727.1 hypothetical protein FOXG_21455 [Fusarium oxysporum f. sp. lycopersici 4287]
MKLEGFMVNQLQSTVHRYTFPINRETTMNVRFVDDPERDPAVLHRRRLQANRTQNCRRCTKTYRNILATYDGAELLPETVKQRTL